ncbi:MAG: GNAT family protein [Alistipes sp.]
MNLDGRICKLRAVELRDVETMYAWENDTALWSVSGTMTPFSRHTLERFVEEQQFDIYQTRQLRLMIETHSGVVVGAIDLFEFDPQNGRAGVGILIHGVEQRGRGYATDALTILCDYSYKVLSLHQLWCNVGSNNIASRALFSKVGFIEVGTKKEWHKGVTGYEDEILMQKIFYSQS